MYGDLEEDSWTKRGDTTSTNHKLANYANKSSCEDHEGSMFMMSHEANHDRTHVKIQ